jgi:hypothetical protein
MMVDITGDYGSSLPYQFAFYEGSLYCFASTLKEGSELHKLSIGVPLAAWRQQHFAGATSSALASNTADADADGQSNVLEYALGGNPLDGKPAALAIKSAQPNASGGAELVFEKPLTVEGLTYSAEWSSSLQANDWHPAPTHQGTGNSVIISTSATTPLAKCFWRIKAEVAP